MKGFSIRNNLALILKEISLQANYEFLGNKSVLPLDASWLVTVADEGKELSRLLVRSVSDFSSILEEMAFSKKSFDAIFSLTEAAAWWCPARPGLLLSIYLLSPLPQQTPGSHYQLVISQLSGLTISETPTTLTLRQYTATWK